MRNRIKTLGAALVGLALIVTACTTEGAAVSSTSPRRAANSGGQLVDAPRALAAFDSCRPFLDYVISHAVDLVGPYGLGDQFYGFPGVGRDFAVEESAADSGLLSAGATSAPSFSETNVQVSGVDEPDIVKTDGERIVVLSEGMLIVTDVTGERPVVEGRLRLGNLNVQSLFLNGDKALLFGSAWNSFHPLVESDVEYAPSYQTPTIQIVEVDLAQGDPSITRTMTIDGRFVSGRMIDDTVRLVMQSGPVGFEWSLPTGSGLRAERRAIEENQEIIRNSRPDNWIPYYLVTDSDGDVVDEGTLFDCQKANQPEEFAGLDMLSVVTIDLSDGLAVTDSMGVLAAGNTVYASAESLYVATQNWDTWLWAASGGGDDEPDRVSTDIHKFDISDARVTTYEATGVVDGYLLNQFAMDEHNGLLRVASTTQPAWWGGGFDSESLVTVLEQSDGVLEEIGKVDGLGLTEQIFSVRFMGDMAYVVTFRQTDPLYTVDLSDPRSPEVVGELKILGYSAYLHPVGDGLLLGVGQDADEDGRIKGAQVSTFDVSDPSDPRKIDQVTLSEGSNSAIEWDHHAFLYWQPTGLAMIPVQQYWWTEESESVFFGAIGLEVGDDGELTEVQQVAHPGSTEQDWDWRAQIMRSVVIGDAIYTISSKGIMKSELDGLDEIDWLGF